ncbi:hypothetical protein [Pseudomonas fluorescens]|uniref:Uncharacterized protein n=1 Tax=Pseudomonas fluorescens TaxID=294 RepID=A0A0F4TPP5_PSEFL|nr:hypothetical protein [Pseudomonas fluorescens]KJZ46418.1 hypothetical protein VC34_06840 [Pseudomonas fluorescens]
MSNEAKTDFGTPIAKAVIQGAFYVSQLGATTEISTPSPMAWPVEAYVLFRASIPGTPDKWESVPVHPTAHTSAQMPVKDFLDKNIHREVEIQFYVVSQGAETPSRVLKVRILP